MYAGLAAALLMVALVAACGSQTPTPTPTQRPTTAAPAQTTATPTSTPTRVASSPEEERYLAAVAKWENEVIPAAKREGRVTWYTCHSLTITEPMARTWRQLWPDIRLDIIEDSPGPLIERITAERTAGRVVADVYNCGGTSARILPWRGHALPAEEVHGPNALDPDFPYWGQLPPADPEGVTIFGYGVGGILVNTTRVPQDKYPKSWWDIINDPFWRNLAANRQLAVGNPFAPGYLPTFMHVWLNTNSLGEAYIKALSDLRPVIIPRGGPEAVARGEVAAFIGGGHAAPYVEFRGAPMKFVAPEDGVWATAFSASVVKGAPNPNAALLFVDQLLTPEMQGAWAQSGNIPIRSDVPLLHPDMAMDNYPVRRWSTGENERHIASLYQWADQQGYFKY